jgi:hypothetical protein
LIATPLYRHTSHGLGALDCYEMEPAIAFEPTTC